MTAGSIFSRLLGAVYIIPWGIWLGSHYDASNALFARGYNIYSLFLIVSTAGIPSAVAKQVAHYIAQDDYPTANKLFRRSLLLMLGLGVVTASLMWLLAPVLALQNGAVDQRLIPVIHALAWPLLLIPPMSILRGYFQGFARMAPSAISQLLEQVARVLYMLAATYVIMVHGSGDYVQAVAQSTFAAFVGAAMALMYLMWVYARQRRAFFATELPAIPPASTRTLLQEVIQQSIPFIILNAGTVLYQFFDQYTFPEILHQFFVVSEAQNDYFYGLFAFNTNKLIMIVVSLASALAITAVPLLAAAYTKGDKNGVAQQIEATLTLFFFVMWPSALGMNAVARPLYTLFYRDDALGIAMLAFNADVAIVIGLFTVLAAVMQGLYQNRLAIRYFLIGFAVKMLLQLPLVYYGLAFGPLIGSLIGFGVTAYLMLRALDATYPLDWHALGARITWLLAAALSMWAVTFFVTTSVDALFGTLRKTTALPGLLAGAGSGTLVYGYLVLRLRLADFAFGPRMAGLRRRLHIR